MQHSKLLVQSRSAADETNNANCLYRSPEDADVESFNGRFRDGCLNQQRFKKIADARSIIEEWRQHYNLVRPHSALNYRSPADYEQAA